MNLPRRLYDGIRNCISRRRAASPDIRVSVSNITRQTVLAECVEIADRGAKRRKGLLGRLQLFPGEGLWILPCEAVHTIGMRFPIDLIFLDRQHRVRKIRSDVPSWRLSGCISAHSVLELPSGTIRNTQTTTGDTLELSDVIPLRDIAYGEPDEVLARIEST
jgi:uncharacterized protein